MEVRQRLVREDQKKNKKKRGLGQLTSSEPGDHADLAPPEELSQAGERRGGLEHRAQGNHSPGRYTVKKQDHREREREKKEENEQTQTSLHICVFNYV